MKKNGTGIRALLGRIFGAGGISSLTSLTLRLSGMREVTEYEIAVKDGVAEVTEYAVKFCESGKIRVPGRRAACGEKEAVDILDRCKALSWDGFYGKHPRGVKDGTAFSLDAVVNGGETIRASGSQNFPRRFHELSDWLYKTVCVGGAANEKE
ncbi:MAG: hypothetical protein IJK33_08990 [Clostridia bacterium]|nr:hypothetical protein [Clostridia bacterium]